MNEEIVDSITSRLANWEYDEEDINDILNKIQTYTKENGKIIEYMITDASESAPNRFDDHALDILFLTQTNIFSVLIDSEFSKYVSTSFDNINSVEIETTSQRIELSIIFNAKKYTAASYNENEFEKIRDFGLSVDSKIKR
jgi:hypothetical protein